MPITIQLKAARNFNFPQSLTTESLLFTGSLPENITSQLARTLHVMCITYYILKVENKKLLRKCTYSIY